MKLGSATVHQELLQALTVSGGENIEETSTRILSGEKFYESVSVQ